MKVTDSRLKATRQRYVTHPETGDYIINPTTGDKIIKNKTQETEDQKMIFGFLYWLQVDENDTVKRHVNILLEKLKNPTLESIEQEMRYLAPYNPTPERINNYATIIGESLNELLIKQSKINRESL
jgi:hypothetical protein